MSTATIPAVSQRIAALKTAVMARGGSFVASFNPFLREVAQWHSALEGRSSVQVRAALLHELVRTAPVEIGPLWELAGEHLMAPPNVSPGFSGDGEPQELSRIRELGVRDEEVAAVREAVERVARARTHAGGPPAEGTEVGRGAWGLDDSTTVYWASGWMENHSIRDYAKVLRVGFGGIRREVEECLAGADCADPDFPRSENFWRAALDVCDAGILLGTRYAGAARRMADETSEAHERERLQRIAQTCSRVPAQGARTFFEAVQALWLAHVLTCGEDGINANSIGRLDQILWPYYEADLAAGRLTRAGAIEIMQEFACKMYLDYDVQAIVLGGTDRKGGSAVNDLSFLILEATRDLDMIRDVSVRLSRSTPVEFVDLAAEMIVGGGGIPFMFNDDCFIEALTERGIALEDARDYAPIGCIELTIPGRTNPHAVSGWLDSAKCLELALYDGVDPTSGRQLGPRTGALADMGRIEDLCTAYREQVEFFARRMVYHCNRGELAQREGGPLPCWSVLTDDCIQRGRDITDGGPVYNYHSICFLGMANTADSLMAVGKLMFEEKRIEAADLLEALKQNFEGHEDMRRMLVERAPKYGNDCAEVDAIAGRICEEFIALMDTMRSPLDGRYFVHLFSFRCNVMFGKTVGALPDGRRAGEPLAYSVSAQQGRDEAGVTAMLNSLARLPHNQAAGATAAMMEIDPVLVEGEAGVRRMSELIRAGIAMGVGHMQWNVVTADRLRQAQEDPEKYGNIAVRVAGYSQMFRLVDRDLQDHIIARTKHRH